MLYVLDPIPVAKYFTLAEAVLWIAFKEYPVSRPAQKEPDLIDEMFINSRLQWPFYEMEGLRHQIYSQYGFTEPVEPEISPFNETDYVKLSEVEREELGKQELDYERQVSGQLDHCISEAKSQLFLKLSRGEVMAYGWKNPKIKRESSGKWLDRRHSGLSESYEIERLIEANMDRVVSGEIVDNFQIINKSFWNYEGVEWLVSMADSTFGQFQWIFLTAESVFEHFPPIQATTVDVEKRGGFLLLNSRNERSEISNVKKLGRREYDWPSFHAEVSRYLLENCEGRLPKLTALEHHMAGWCKENWNVNVSHGSLHKHLSPYVSALKKS